jgi:hypothetical protein
VHAHFLNILINMKGAKGFKKLSLLIRRPEEAAKKLSLKVQFRPSYCPRSPVVLASRWALWLRYHHLKY